MFFFTQKFLPLPVFLPTTQQPEKIFSLIAQPPLFVVGENTGSVSDMKPINFSYFHFNHSKPCTLS
jgi:hypothetical protein